MTQEKTPTIGEKRVNLNFNTDGNDYVNDLKIASAGLIDLIDRAANNPDWDDKTLGEWRRLKSLAMTAAEESCMWAVKAARI